MLHNEAVRPLPEVHLCEPDHANDPQYEDVVEGARAKMMRNTILGLIGPWLLGGAGYVGYLLITGGNLPF